METYDGHAVAVTSRGTTRWIEIEAAGGHGPSPASRKRTIGHLFDPAFDGELEITIIEKDSMREPQRRLIGAAALNGNPRAEGTRFVEDLLGGGYEGRIEVQVTQLRHRRRHLYRA